MMGSVGVANVFTAVTDSDIIELQMMTKIMTLIVMSTDLDYIDNNDNHKINESTVNNRNRKKDKLFNFLIRWWPLTLTVMMMEGIITIAIVVGTVAVFIFFGILIIVYCYHYCHHCRCLHHYR